MKNFYLITFFIIALFLIKKAEAQNYPHYTMFMYNKLLYNPAYVGNKGVTTFNGYYRKQWSGLEGSPTGLSLTVDGPVGNFMKPFRPVALGLSITNEKVGITNNTNLMAYYAYRVKMGKGVMSLGLQAGVSLYSARYSDLNPYQLDDPDLQNDIKNRPLPNVGAGLYYSTNNYYLGIAVPYLLQNYYDEANTLEGDNRGKQIRTYFVSAGYVFTVSYDFKIEPQVLVRYAANNQNQMTANADFNLMFFLFDRFAPGITYRTDKSIEAILFMQVTKSVNLGFSYDFALSDIRNYNNGTYEVTLGYDILRNQKKYINPRFIKYF